MALWTGLGQAATVAQLVGADVSGLISMIVKAALTARQNRKDCEHLARRVVMIAQLLPHVHEPESAQQLAGLGDTLFDAHELVMSCQGRSAAYQLVMAGRQAGREVQGGVEQDRFLPHLFPVISHIGITRRLERIYDVLVQQDDSTRAEPSQLSQSWTQMQEVVLHGTQEEFTLAEMMTATNNFSLDSRIGEGGFGIVHRGRLHDGREVVAVKRMRNTEPSFSQEVFRRELDILSRLRHKHMIRLLGSCATEATRKRKGLSTRRRKEPECLIVYEYMENGSLLQLIRALPRRRRSCYPGRFVSMCSSACRAPWSTCTVMPTHPCIVHRDVSPNNILLDATPSVPN